MPQIGAHIYKEDNKKNCSKRERERNRARGTEKANKSINKKENMGNTVRLKQLKEWPI